MNERRTALLAALLLLAASGCDIGRATDVDRTSGGGTLLQTEIRFSGTPPDTIAPPDTTAGATTQGDPTIGSPETD